MITAARYRSIVAAELSRSSRFTFCSLPSGHIVVPYGFKVSRGNEALTRRCNQGTGEQVEVSSVPPSTIAERNEPFSSANLARNNQTDVYRQITKNHSTSSVVSDRLPTAHVLDTFESSPVTVPSLRRDRSTPARRSSISDPSISGRRPRTFSGDLSIHATRTYYRRLVGGDGGHRSFFKRRKCIPRQR